MTQDESAKGEAIKASVELIKTAYGDALKPVSQEVGKALGTIGKTVNLALVPLKGLVWSWDLIEEYLSKTVQEKLTQRNVPPESIITPDPDIAVPAIQALTYSKLKENYAKLVATAMDGESKVKAHPAFVEILKQITPTEAKILEYFPVLGRFQPLINITFEIPEKGRFNHYKHLGTIANDAGCSSSEDIPPLLENLCRLGLVEIPPQLHLVEDWRYERIRATSLYSQLKNSIPTEGVFEEERRMIGLTALGMSFRKACIE